MSNPKALEPNVRMSWRNPPTWVAKAILEFWNFSGLDERFKVWGSVKLTVGIGRGRYMIIYPKRRQKEILVQIIQTSVLGTVREAIDKKKVLNFTRCKQEPNRC